MENYRILADNQYRDNNTWVSGLNNNDLIIGPSGAGKTRNYVKPNLMQCNESMVITDTKGTLHRQMGSLLEENGYKVILIDYKNLGNSYGYNPFDYIRYDTVSKQYNEQDILTISANIVTGGNINDPFWELAARMYLTSLIAYCLETKSAKEHNLETVYKLFTDLITDQYGSMISAHEKLHPKSFAARQYKLFAANTKAEKMNTSILGILAEKINVLVLPELVNMYTAEKRLNFAEMAEKKTAVFLTVSDTDRSMDQLVGLFYAQALNTLCNIADNKKEGRLNIPVRFYLDDFATNTVIDGFDNVISVIRSREIYVSIILQSISQLNALYGTAKAKTIINNCDNCLYLGGQDVETADFIAVKANKSINEILNMPLGKAHLFTRGVGGLEVKKYDIKTHEKYCDLPEYRDISKENPTKESLSEVTEVAEVHETSSFVTSLLQELWEHENKKSKKKSSFQERRQLAQKESTKTFTNNKLEVYNMNEKTPNWVYLFDKHHISQTEAEEYTTKNPDLTSSDLTQEESEYYASADLLMESVILDDYLKMQREEQARLLGCTPEEYDNFEELFFNSPNEDELEYDSEENTKDVIKEFGAPLLVHVEENVLSDQELQEREERKQATQEAYEKEKFLVEEAMMSEYILSCRQDLKDNIKKSRDVKSADT